MANTYTDLLKLRMPAAGDTGWDDEVNENTKIAEVAFDGLLGTNFVVSGLTPSDGGGLNVDYTAGVVNIGGVLYSISASSKAATASNLNFLYVDSSGTMQINTVAPTGSYVPIAIVDAGIAALDRIGDLRNLAPAPGEIKQNLLANSGFGVWSNGALANVGNQVTVTDVTNGVCSTANTQDLAVGKLFRFNAGDFNAEHYEITAITPNVDFTLNDTSLNDVGAPGTGYEVTPSCTAADALGPDGFEKTTTLDLYREHNGTYTKDGAFYALKAVKGDNGAEYCWFNNRAHDKPEWYTQFLGRVVTIGAWVYSVSAADNIKLAIYHNAGWAVSSAHAGADAWEWMELTAVINASSVDVRFGFLFDGDSADVAYVSQPTVIFGSIIGEGNYVPIPNEIILLDNEIDSDGMVASYSDTGWTDLNVEVDTLGRVPKGCKALVIMTAVNDSGSAGETTCILAIRPDATVNYMYVNSVGGIANDAVSYYGGWTPCDPDGDVQYNVFASGANTFDIPAMRYNAVMV